MNMQEFNILSMQFKCRNQLGADLLQDHRIRPTAQNFVYNTSVVLIDETIELGQTIYAMYRYYQKVIEEVNGHQGTVRLYITHHTQKARELVLSPSLLQFLAENKSDLGVD